MPNYSVEFMGLDNWFMGALGVSQPIAELMAFLTVLGIFILPTFFLKTSNYIISMIMFMLIATFTAVGWLPFYTWILMVLYFAITISGKMKGWF